MKIDLHGIHLTEESHDDYSAYQIPWPPVNLFVCVLFPFLSLRKSPQNRQRLILYRQQRQREESRVGA